MIDLRAKTAMFAKQEGFSVIASKPKTDAEFAKLVFDSILKSKLSEAEQEDDIKTIGDQFKKEKVENEFEAFKTETALKFTVKTLVKTLKSAMEGGLTPLEYKYDVGSGKLTIYAPLEAKCPEAKSLVKEKEGVTAGKWEKTKVSITKDKKKEEVACQAITISFDIGKVPGLKAEMKAEMQRFSEQLTARIQKANAALYEKPKHTELQAAKIQSDLAEAQTKLQQALLAQFKEQRAAASDEITDEELLAAARVTADLSAYLGVAITVEGSHGDRDYQNLAGFKLILAKQVNWTPEVGVKAYQILEQYRHSLRIGTFSYKKEEGDHSPSRLWIGRGNGHGYKDPFIFMGRLKPADR